MLLQLVAGFCKSSLKSSPMNISFLLMFFFGFCVNFFGIKGSVRVNRLTSSKYTRKLCIFFHKLPILVMCLLVQNGVLVLITFRKNRLR